MSFLQQKKSLPYLGTGLGLRRELANKTFEHAERIDWLEIVPENYMNLGGKARERLEQAASCFTLISHGLNLSIGSVDPLNKAYLASLKNLLDTVDSPWWSDHLCFTSINGTYLHDLLPIPLSTKSIKHVVKRIKAAQDFVARPFLLENISYYMQVPGSFLDETEFIGEILESADCGLLLDINNVYVNSLNHGFDPVAFIDALPLDRVVQIHVAGHKRIGEYIIDTHGESVSQPVFDLLRHVLRKANVQAVMLERDQNFPDFTELLTELNQIKTLSLECCPSLNNKKKAATIKQAISIANRMHNDADTGKVERGRECRLLTT